MTHPCVLGWCTSLAAPGRERNDLVRVPCAGPGQEAPRSCRAQGCMCVVDGHGCDALMPKAFPEFINKMSIAQQATAGVFHHQQARDPDQEVLMNNRPGPIRSHCPVRLMPPPSETLQMDRPCMPPLHSVLLVSTPETHTSPVGGWVDDEQEGVCGAARGREAAGAQAPHAHTPPSFSHNGIALHKSCLGACLVGNRQGGSDCWVPALDAYLLH
jgi:hypothetical protein